MTVVAVLGLGAMGRRMAERFVAAGHDVRVWNRSPARAASLGGASRITATPREAAEGADVIVSVVTDDDAARAVWLTEGTGAMHGVGRGALVVESSTTTAAWVRSLAHAAVARGAACIDAPVVGSRPQAEAGQLIHLIGGTDADVGRALPILAAVGAAAHHVGPLGTGTVLKLAVNALFAIQVATLAEWWPLLQDGGVTSARAQDVLGALPVLSPAAKGAIGLIVSGNTSPQFPIALVEKDLRYALAQAGDGPSVAPLTESAWQQYTRAMRRGFGGDNITGIAQLYARQADGVHESR